MIVIHLCVPLAGYDPRHTFQSIFFSRTHSFCSHRKIICYCNLCCIWFGCEFVGPIMLTQNGTCTRWNCHSQLTYLVFSHIHTRSWNCMECTFLLFWMCQTNYENRIREQMNVYTIYTIILKWQSVLWFRGMQWAHTKTSLNEMSKLIDLCICDSRNDTARTSLHVLACGWNSYGNNERVCVSGVYMLDAIWPLYHWKLYIWVLQWSE